MESNFKQRLKSVRCFILDVDGVLTDGSLIVMPNELIRVMNIKDGYAIKQAVDADYIVAVISGGKSESVRTRLSNLGVKDIFLGVEDKVEKMEELILEYDLKREEILYMGDDLPDFEAMRRSGTACCPADAAVEIKSICSYISPINGGQGCVRDVIEQVMRLKGNWPEMNG